MTLNGGVDEYWNNMLQNIMQGYGDGSAPAFYGPPPSMGLGRNTLPPVFNPGMSAEDLQRMRDTQGSWLNMGQGAMQGFLDQGGNEYDRLARDQIMGLLGGLGGGGGGYGAILGGGGGGTGAGPGRFENMMYNYADPILSDPTGNPMMQEMTALNQRLASENFNKDWGRNAGEAAKFGMGSSSALAKNQADASERMGLGLGQANTESLGLTQGLGLQAANQGGGWENSRVNTNTANATSRANAGTAARASMYGTDMNARMGALGLLTGMGSDIGGRGLSALGMLPGFEGMNSDTLAAIYDRQYGSEQDQYKARAARANAMRQAQMANAMRQYEYQKDLWQHNNYGQLNQAQAYFPMLAALSAPHTEQWTNTWGKTQGDGGGSNFFSDLLGGALAGSQIYSGFGNNSGQTTAPVS